MYINRQMFGHGLAFAGLTIITLLGQKDRFEAMDFSYHVLRVHKEGQQDDIVPGVSLKRFIKEVKHMKELNDSMSTVLDRYLPRSNKLDIYVAPPGADKLPKVPQQNRSLQSRPGSTMV